MIFSLVVGLIALVSLIGHNIYRARKRILWNLKPNCLMTRYPIVFVTGKRSIFYFLNFWNQIPDFLNQHGYDVQILSLDWFKVEVRKKQLEIFFRDLEKHHKKIHLFIDASSLSEIIYLMVRKDFSSIKSINLVSNQYTPPPFRMKVPIYDLNLKNLVPGKNPWFWKAHKFFIYDSADSIYNVGWKLEESNGFQFLDRLQDLAERDLRDADKFHSL